jgi:hypothetical protein
MDPISIAASIIAILELSRKVVDYLNSVKEAPKERKVCATEILTLYHLLLSLRRRLEEGTSGESWFTAVRSLAIKGGPLDQFKEALETLQDKLADKGPLKRIGDALSWRLVKEDVMSILNRIERIKSGVLIALEHDNL